MKKISLANLDCKERLKKVKEIHPILIFFICYRGRPNKYPIDSRILDIQEDCKVLSKKLDLMNYKGPSKRVSHNVTYKDCVFKRSGRLMFNELKEKKICKLIHEKCNFKDRESFATSFEDCFTFKEDLGDIIQLKLNEIKRKTGVSLAKNNFSFNKHGIEFRIIYKITAKKFIASINLKCKCKKKTSINIEEKDLIHHLQSSIPFLINCDSCRKEFYISSDLHYTLNSTF